MSGKYYQRRLELTACTGHPLDDTESLVIRHQMRDVRSELNINALPLLIRPNSVGHAVGGYNNPDFELRRRTGESGLYYSQRIHASSEVVANALHQLDLPAMTNHGADARNVGSVETATTAPSTPSVTDFLPGADSPSDVVRCPPRTRFRVGGEADVFFGFCTDADEVGAGISPIKDTEWRVESIHPLAGRYCSIVDVRFSLGNLEVAIFADMGLILALNSYTDDARHIQEIQLRKKAATWIYIESHRHLYPSVAHHVDDIFRLGVVPPFTEVPASSSANGLPRKSSESLAIVENSWKYIRIFTAFVVAKVEIPKHERIEFSPTHTVWKRNADRRISAECKVTPDLRCNNLWIKKADTFPACVTGIDRICERIASLETRYRGFSVQLAKRDIDNAFGSVPLHPDCSRAFVHCFDATDVGSRFSVSIGFLALPFGFLASPSYFALATSPIQAIHQRHKPADVSWNDCDNYSAFLYIDDGIFAGSTIGRRSGDCIVLWGKIAKEVLGEDCINEEKIAVDAAWSEGMLVSGFLLNTRTMEISVPEVKVPGAADYIPSGVFSEGC